MDNWYFNWINAQRRQEEELARAEMERLAAKARLATSTHQGSPRSFPRLQHILAALGGLLVNWGCRLQSRYSPITLPSLGGELAASGLNGSEPKPCSG